MEGKREVSLSLGSEKGVKGEMKRKRELNNRSTLFSFCRGDRIRTCGRLVPNQERYRAALHPECIFLFVSERKRCLADSNRR